MAIIIEWYKQTENKEYKYKGYLLNTSVNYTPLAEFESNSTTLLIDFLKVKAISLGLQVTRVKETYK